MKESPRETSMRTALEKIADMYWKKGGTLKKARYIAGATLHNIEKSAQVEHGPDSPSG